MTLDDFRKKWGHKGASYILNQAAHCLDNGVPLPADHLQDIRNIAEDLYSILHPEGNADEKTH